jgi:octaprenyl-diphosphate synthase
VSPVLNQTDFISTSLRTLYAPIADELQETEQILREEMQSEFPFVDELVRYGVLLGGKRLRPALLLLTGKAIGSLTREHLVLGAVVEMIHTATLVHDDVLDEAETRRHLATVNSRWDNKASVLLGDYLFTHAFYLASTLSSTRACRLIGFATNTVCAGELRQKGTIGDFGLTEDEYLDIISAKTAELCACSCELGAHYSDAPTELVASMACFGRDLGIAFQIADDVLDVVGDEQTTGKSLGTDIEQQKPTLPIIRVLQLATASEREQLLTILQNDSIDRLAALRPYFERYDAIAYAKQQALSFAERATRQLRSLPPSASSDTLATMAEFVVARSR